MTATAHERSTAWTPEGTFAERLALIRVHHGWNVLEAAKACGMPRATWASWEAGVSPRDFVQACHKVAAAANVDVYWLMTGQVTVQYPPGSSSPFGLAA
jgi:transcriptional regulator with XRE-family HTH domain